MDNMKKQHDAPKPTRALDKIKEFVSPKSTAGTLRDRKSSLDEKIKKAGG